MKKWPNKALEPTTTAVTSRASASELLRHDEQSPQQK
jgi:hypothetical protein